MVNPLKISPMVTGRKRVTCNVLVIICVFILSGRMNGTQNLSTIQESLASIAVADGSHIHPSNRIIINVGGIRFETYRSTLRNFPDTRLAWITETKSDNTDYDPLTGEYFFDRHPGMFLMILNYYRTGKLHAPVDVCGPAFEDELAFWGLDEKQIESCCWGPYCQHRDAQQTIENLNLSQVAENDIEDHEDDINETAQKFGIAEDCKDPCNPSSKWLQRKSLLWIMLNDHSSSLLAKIFMVISVLLTLTMMLTFMLETHPCCREWRNESNQSLTKPSLQQYRKNTQPIPLIRYLEATCMVELLIEVILRVLSCPSKRLFFKNVLNWIDILTVISFIISTILFAYHIELSNHKYLLPLQFLRMARVFKIFNVARHLRGLKILFHTLQASAKELLLMLILIVSLGTVFASLIYFAEQIDESDENHFESIPISFWWAIVTMTTLGYGDKVPKTTYGYLVGMFCAIFGVLFITLPVPIIVNNFSIYYSHAQAQQKLPKKRKNVLVGAADLLKQQIQTISPDYDTMSIDSKLDTFQHSPRSNRLNNVLGECNGEDDSGKRVNSAFTDSNDISPSENVCNQDVSSKASTEVSEQQQQRGEPSANNSVRTSMLLSNSRAPMKRRGSLLPGGVSNSGHDNSSSSPSQPECKLSTSSLDGKVNARDRRRSILPTASAYTIY